MDILNNREISTGIWFIIIFCYVIYKSDVRDSIKDLFHAFFNKKIFIPFLLMFIYSLFLVFLLDQISLWKTHQIKNYVLWFFSVAAVTFFRINKIADDPSYFSKTIKDSFKIIILFQFILSVYTFNIWVELFLVPLVGLIAILLAFAELNEEHQNIIKPLTFIIELFGLIIIGFTIYKIITDFGEIAKEQTFYDLVVPTLLSLMILPYFYLLAIFINYENVFLRIQYFIHDKELLIYAKLKAIIRFNVNTLVLKRWTDSLVNNNIKSKADVNKSIDEVYRLISIEKNPPIVSKEDGWSPYIAKDFLKEAKLNTGYYKKSYDDEWFASSTLVSIGKGVLSNNLAYYIEGNSHAAKILKIKLNMNDLNDAKELHHKLLETAQLLCMNAIGKKIPSKIKSAILNAKNKSLIFESRKLTVTKNEWHINEPYYGYSIEFMIETI